MLQEGSLWARSVQQARVSHSHERYLTEIPVQANPSMATKDFCGAFLCHLDHALFLPERQV
jgi:hypothetical protein